MKEITLEESKQIQIKILENIDSFCRNNNIHYSLSGGTMIGAIRHKGFIPWDDDIDLMMLREDYDKFLLSYSDEYYKLLSFKKIKNWPFLYCSVVDPQTILYYGNRKDENRGVWVSIFPVENIDENKIPHMVKYLRFFEKGIVRLKKSYWTPNTNLFYNLSKALCRFLLLPFPCSFWLKQLEKVIINPNCTGLLGLPSVWMYIRVYHFSKSVFNDYIDVDFENLKCMVIAGYDEFLHGVYGDYMTLPPEKDRVSKHGYTAYWK